MTVTPFVRRLLEIVATGEGKFRVHPGGLGNRLWPAVGGRAARHHQQGVAMNAMRHLNRAERAGLLRLYYASASPLSRETVLFARLTLRGEEVLQEGVE